MAPTATPQQEDEEDEQEEDDEDQEDAASGEALDGSSDDSEEGLLDPTKLWAGLTTGAASLFSAVFPREPEVAQSAPVKAPRPAQRSLSMPMSHQEEQCYQQAGLGVIKRQSSIVRSSRRERARRSQTIPTIVLATGDQVRSISPRRLHLSLQAWQREQNAIAEAESANEAPTESSWTHDVRCEFHKACWQTITFFGQRRILSSLGSFLPCSTTTNYDASVHPGVTGAVALTIDDAPCRHRDQSMSMVRRVKDMLQQFQAKATFFLCTDYVPGHEDDMVALLQDGHEVANHCPADRSYFDEEEAAFEEALLQAERVCEDLRRRAAGETTCVLPASALKPAAEDGAIPSAEVRWFRAPHARLSNAMAEVLNRHGFTHVLSDCYANDPWISDPAFIAQTMVETAQDGSVLVVHMPEYGFREYNLQAIHDLLEGLQARGLKVVTLSNLHEMAVGQSCTRA